MIRESNKLNQDGLSSAEIRIFWSHVACETYDEVKLADEDGLDPHPAEADLIHPPSLLVRQGCKKLPSLPTFKYKVTLKTAQ